ncbi:uncharacterized protein LOC126735425 isoform X2 [Anthonomus grandis grandis]|uniref:uncharacterized protein LOC126735425 isoform X2 n=1 Tax=Anthonomus grandis grandis TaxID=2921223 RepID=UPI0021652E19|nr:uncharacterized protein LOC126735425 isoform X2 [Anthonomus grandis grandis]
MCNKEKNFEKTLFDEHLPKYWRNSTVHIYYRNAPPFTNKDHTGAEQILFSAIFKKLGVKISSQMGSLTFQGLKVNRTYESEGLRLLSQRKVHMIAGSYKAISEFYQDFDSSLVYYLQQSTLFAPSALKKSLFEVLYSVTIKGMGVFTCVIIIWCFFVKLAYGIRCGPLIGICYLINMSQPINKIHKLKFRYALAGLMFGTYLYNTLIFGYIKTSFLNEQYQKDVHTINDALESNLQVLISPELMQSFMKHSDESDRRLINKIGICKIKLSDCLKKVCWDRSTAMVGLIVIMNYLAFDVCPNQIGGRPQIHIGQQITKDLIQSYFIKGWPMAEDINSILFRIWFIAGIIRKEESKVEVHYYKITNKMFGISIKSTSLLF